MDKNKIIQAATKYVQKGLFDKAIKEYQRIVEEDPRDIRVLLKIGELYQKRGDNKDAAATLLRVAEAYSNDGFFLKAAAVYKQVLKLNPALLDVNLRLAELYQQLGLMSDAMQQYQLVAVTYEKQGNGRASLGLLKKLVDLEPDNASSRVRLAEAYSNEGLTEEAIAELGRVADQLKQAGRNDEFIKVAERLLFLDASNLELTRELAGLYLSRGDTKRALAKLQLCFKANPQDVDTLVLLAQTFLDLGQAVKTVSVYKELAKIYAEAGRVEEEQVTWRRVLALVPADAEALAATGQPAEEPLEATLEPEPPFAEVPELEPSPPSRSTVVARPAAGRPGPGPAVPPSARPGPARPDPRAGEIQKLLTETDVYLKYGLHEKAADHLKRLLTAAPRSLAAHQKAKELYLLTGDKSAAADELVRCAQLSLEAGDQAAAKGFAAQLRALAPAHPQLRQLLGGERGWGEPPEVDTDDAILVDQPEDPPEARGEALTDVGAYPVAPLPRRWAVGRHELAAADEPTLIHAELQTSAEAEEATEIDDGDLLDSAELGNDATELGEEPLVEDAAELESARMAIELAGEPRAPPGLSSPPGAPVPGLPSPRGQIPPPPLLAVVRGTGGSGAGELGSGDPPRRPMAQPSPALRATTLPRILVPAAPDPSAASAPPLPGPISDGAEEPPDELAEAEFFLDHGLLDDAADTLAVLRRLVVGRPGLVLRVAELERRLAAARSPPAGDAGAQAEVPATFDLAADLADEVAKTGAPATGEDFQYSVEDVLSEFKKGVARVVKPEDVDTHYDLGIAYNEMGLIDEAIAEFQVALNGAEGKPKEVDCLAMLGTCLSHRGAYDRAVAAFERALRSRFLKPEGRLNAFFEIGVAREAAGESAAALESFEKVARIDPTYRQVSEALGRLRKSAPARGPTLARRPSGLGDDAEVSSNGQGSSRAGKVGYV